MPRYRLAKIDASPHWYVTWTEGRRSRRRSTGTATLEAAEAFLNVFAAGRLEGGADPLLAAVLDAYLDEHAKGLASEERSTISAGHLKAFFGDTLASDVTPRRLAQYIESRPVSAATVGRELSVLRAALNRAARQGHIDRAPHVPAPKAGPPRERWLTRSEAARLLKAAATPHLRLFIRLALYTGARTGAILDLVWQRVDLDNGLIDFGAGAGDKRRAVVPVQGALARALGFWRRDSGPVIAWVGKPVGSIKRGFRRAAETAGLAGVTPHTLRHTAATWAALAGVDLHAIGGMLGHTNPLTTKRYAKYHPDYLRDAATAMLRGPRRKRQGNGARK